MNNQRTQLEKLKCERKRIKTKVMYATKQLQSAAAYYTNELSRLKNIDEEIDTERFRELGLDRAGNKL